MKYENKVNAILLLEDGSVYHGKACGKIGTATGELAFNTGMTGYQEIFTDPSYYGQIMLTTTSHIGNYGVHEEEIESDGMKISGLVCKKFSTTFSRAGKTQSIQSSFENEGMVGISDVDTRAIVRHIRDKGAMNAIISSEITDVEELKAKLNDVPSMAGLELASKVSCTEPYFVGDENSDFKVAVLDLGVKKNILRCLADRGCYLKIFPYNSEASDLLDWNPNGIFLSNGPGDPEAMPNVFEEVKSILNAGLPVFGICMGHQMIAKAMGLKTYKMHNGHRGINHPVKNLITGKCEVTSQNHGFVVDMESANQHDNIEVTHQHLNDNTLAGLRLKDRDIFSVQYHPEASPGPHDSRYLFDNFVENMKKVNQKELA